MYLVGSKIELWMIYLLNGLPQSGKTNLKVVVNSSEGTQLLEEPLIENLDHEGKYSFNWNTVGADAGQYTAHFYEDSVLIGAESYFLDSNIAEIRSMTDKILNVEEGDWEIVGNQMIFRDRDKVELFRFNLYDDSGVPSATSVFKRERA